MNPEFHEALNMQWFCSSVTFSRLALHWQSAARRSISQFSGARQRVICCVSSPFTFPRNFVRTAALPIQFQLMKPTAVPLELIPRQRTEITDVVPLLTERCGGVLAPYRKLLYCSMHTTAGFLDPSMAAKMDYRREAVEALIQSGKRLFPSGAPYWHDRMYLRSELTEEQKQREPHNADSHLVYISMGLGSVVEYENDPDRPVYFVDLDGVYDSIHRQRKSVVVGYNTRECVYEHVVSVAMPDKPVVSVNLGEAIIGNGADLEIMIRKHQIHRGTVEFALEDCEEHAGLTVNEFEPLLIENDLAGVLDNPIHYMKKEAVGIVRDPLSLPKRAKKYLIQDLIQIINEIVVTVGRHTSILERVIERLERSIPYLERVIEYVATTSASRWMGLNRAVSLLVGGVGDQSSSHLVTGTYQSPILIQWRRPASLTRRVRVRLIRFE